MHVLVTPKIHKELRKLANDSSNPKSVNELVNRGIELILKTQGKALRRVA